jgi:DNA mismatch repair protein MutS2
MKLNRQVGLVKEIRGKKALLQVGAVPMLVALKDLVVVIDKHPSSDQPSEKSGKIN